MTDEVPRSIDTVVIGAGQAGVLMSWHLQRAGRDHVVLDRRETLGGGWQDRWDGFRLVSPNWTSGLPGFPCDDPDPDGFMPRDAMVARIAREPPEVEAMDLAAEGITTVLWTTGYAPDYARLDFPIRDAFGVPRQVAGQTEVPGLTCLGQLWQRNAASANLAGVHVDVALLAAGW
jgi:hypothetical protein